MDIYFNGITASNSPLLKPLYDPPPLLKALLLPCNGSKLASCEAKLYTLQSNRVQIAIYFG